MINRSKLKRKGETVARGERQGSSKLKENEVLELVDAVNSGEYTISSIAKAFGITTTTVRWIMQGKVWSWLTKIPKKER